jgi:hypothetical protein
MRPADEPKGEAVVKVATFGRFLGKCELQETRIREGASVRR